MFLDILERNGKDPKIILSPIGFGQQLKVAHTRKEVDPTWRESQHNFSAEWHG